MSSRAVPANLLAEPMGKNSHIGNAQNFLNLARIESFVRESIQSIEILNKSVTLIIPDGTRSCPLPMLLPIVYQELMGKVSSLSALIALGTHAPMSTDEIDTFLTGPGGTAENLYPKMKILNHEWWIPETFVNIGSITSREIHEISIGRMNHEVPIIINRLVTESDVVLIIGPVFPHEVVGFSGGAKYLFPGVSGKEMIDTSHWLGALISSSEIIGTLGITPVREMINLAAGKIKSSLYALCLVVETGSGNIHSLSFGGPHTAWELATAISSKTHIKYEKNPIKRVLSIMPSRYADIWTAAKGMYKVEPIVCDGGEVILFAPHITEFSLTNKKLEEIGYHCREYFTEQWDLFKDFPTALMAHSAHLRGGGTYSQEFGEKCRIKVTLATGISKERTEAMNLGYLDPYDIDFDYYESDPNTLVNHNAGEILYRLEKS